jgi:hypothetical protein
MLILSRKIFLRIIIFYLFPLIFFVNHKVVKANTINHCSRELSKHSEIPLDSVSISITDDLKQSCSEVDCSPQTIKKSVYKRLMDSKFKAYAALASVMLSTSAASAFIANSVGENNPGLSYFIATFLSQLTSLGVYVVGAPFWEPLQSKIRVLAYKTTGEHQEIQEPFDLLEQQYFRTNRTLSLNSQMSRNVLRDYIKTLTQSLYEAKKFENDLEYVCAQIAEVAVRLKTLYPDVNPSDPLIINSVRMVFTRFIHSPQALIPKVLDYINELDDPILYEDIIRGWLTIDDSNL